MNLITVGLILALLNNCHSAEAFVKFTNFECREFDKPFATIPICKLKVVQRGVVALELHVKLHQTPVNNITVTTQLFKRASGYRPFLYNVSHDFCRVMKTRKRYPFINIFLNFLTKYSNINHTCPYDHDIIIERLILKDEMFKLLPLPGGDYMMFVKVLAYNDLKASFKFYATAAKTNLG